MSIKAWVAVMVLCLPLPLSAIMTRKWVTLLPANKVWRKLVVNTFWLSLATSLLIEIMLLIDDLHGESQMLIPIWLMLSIPYIAVCVLISLFIGPVLVYFMGKTGNDLRLKDTEVTK